MFPISSKISFFNGGGGVGFDIVSSGVLGKYNNVWLDSIFTFFFFFLCSSFLFYDVVLE